MNDPQSILSAYAPFVFIFAVFYFLLIRPQQKKAKEHKAMLDSLRRGDRIVTGGGIIGTIVKVIGENELLVEIAENTRARVVRATVSEVLAKTEPAAKEDDAAEETATAAQPAADKAETGKTRRRFLPRSAGGK